MTEAHIANDNGWSPLDAVAELRRMIRDLEGEPTRGIPFERNARIHALLKTLRALERRFLVTYFY
jgi:hypothetical protein